MAQLDGWNVRANCPDCGGAVTTFEYALGGREFGTVAIGKSGDFGGRAFGGTCFRLLRCAGCGRGALAEVGIDGRQQPVVLIDFFPRTLSLLELPNQVPAEIVKEYREAELCASVGAWRAASALFRSALEKTLKANGYIKGTLQARIDEAAEDGVITAARSQRAHENVRVLGNDVLHDEWREVSEEEALSSRRYIQRILEDLYDDRPSVDAILRAKGRIAEAKTS